MKYKILESDPIHNVHKFFVDTIADLETLPKEPASTAVVATTGDTYICTNAGTYVMYIDNPIENTDDTFSGVTEHKITLDLTIDETLSSDDITVGLYKGDVENKIPVITGKEITSAIPGTLVGIDVSNVGPYPPYRIELSSECTDITVIEDIVGTEDKTAVALAVHTYIIEDTRYNDDETGAPGGHWLGFFIMPDSDVVVNLSIYEEQE